MFSFERKNIGIIAKFALIFIFASTAQKQWRGSGFSWHSHL